MKNKINRYEVTEAQRQAIAAGITALGEIAQAHQQTNPKYGTFEIELKVSHERKVSCWEDGPKTWGFFRVGDYVSGNGSGHSIDAALNDMFAKTDAGEKRAFAERCRAAAQKAEEEAAELESAATPEANA